MLNVSHSPLDTAAAAAAVSPRRHLLPVPKKTATRVDLPEAGPQSSTNGGVAATDGEQQPQQRPTRSSYMHRADQPVLPDGFVAESVVAKIWQQPPPASFAPSSAPPRRGSWQTLEVRLPYNACTPDLGILLAAAHSFDGMEPEGSAVVCFLTG